MKFGPVALKDAEGAILAHSQQIERDGQTARLRKGCVLTREDIVALGATGLKTVTVARLELGDVHEDAAAAREHRRANRSATGIAKRALAELDLEPDAKAPEIRARYAEYVRRFHPDSNSGDRSSEEKLARVIKAGKTLKAAGLMKD